MNAFDWKEEPSAIADSLKCNAGLAKGGRKNGDRFRQYEGMAKYKQNIGTTIPGNNRVKSRKKREALIAIIGIPATEREREIRRCAVEIPRHQQLALLHEKECWRLHHGMKAEELAAKVEMLKALRPAGFVEVA